jgi:uncharacterized RDD family membrane protein YckC
MFFDLQKASALKRFSAYLLDLILICVLVTGIAFLMSAVLGFDGYLSTFETGYASYEAEWGVDFDISAEDYAKLDDEDKAYFNDAYKAFSTDPKIAFAYDMLINLALTILSVSVLLVYLILEFFVPLIFGNGQTVGKKIFGIGVMQQNHVKVTPVQLFVRSILGKCTVETMVPMLIALMIFVGSLGVVGTGVLIVMLIMQIVLIVVTKANCAIHDVLSATVVVDMHSQMIFESPEALLEYKKKRAEDAAAAMKY